MYMCLDGAVDSVLASPRCVGRFMMECYVRYDLNVMKGACLCFYVCVCAWMGGCIYACVSY